jgi:hypothetical protein
LATVRAGWAFRTTRLLDNQVRDDGKGDDDICRTVGLRNRAIICDLEIEPLMSAARGEGQARRRMISADSRNACLMAAVFSDDRSSSNVLSSDCKMNKSQLSVTICKELYALFQGISC